MESDWAYDSGLACVVVDRDEDVVCIELFDFE